MAKKARNPLSESLSGVSGVIGVCSNQYPLTCTAILARRVGGNAGNASNAVNHKSVSIRKVVNSRVFKAMAILDSAHMSHEISAQSPSVDIAVPFTGNCL